MLNNLPYQSATPFRSYVSEVPVEVQLTDGGQTVLATQVELTPPAFRTRLVGDFEVDTRWVVAGDAASSVTPLTVASVPGQEIGTDDEVSYRIQVFSTATDLPPISITLASEGRVSICCDNPNTITYLTPFASESPDDPGPSFGLGNRNFNAVQFDYLRFEPGPSENFRPNESLFAVLTGLEGGYEIAVFSASAESSLVMPGVTASDTCE
ncbi:MAG: hypothetical protein AAFU77_02790 [Myxococcota bacterium]